jgi:hypothetical protein
MDTTMREFKETARAHMSRDIKARGKWYCRCEACHEMRALTGMDKMLGVWPLVRALEQLHHEIAQLPDGQVKQDRRAQWDRLYDELAAEMAR